jgi:hypothetical protein
VWRRAKDVAAEFITTLLDEATISAAGRFAEKIQSVSLYPRESRGPEITGTRTMSGPGIFLLKMHHDISGAYAVFFVVRITPFGTELW